MNKRKVPFSIYIIVAIVIIITGLSSYVTISINKGKADIEAMSLYELTGITQINEEVLSQDNNWNLAYLNKQVMLDDVKELFSYLEKEKFELVTSEDDNLRYNNVISIGNGSYVKISDSGVIYLVGDLFQYQGERFSNTWWYCKSLDYQPILLKFNVNEDMLVKTKEYTSRWFGLNAKESEVSPDETVYNLLNQIAGVEKTLTYKDVLIKAVNKTGQDKYEISYDAIKLNSDYNKGVDDPYYFNETQRVEHIIIDNKVLFLVHSDKGYQIISAVQGLEDKARYLTQNNNYYRIFILDDKVIAVAEQSYPLNK